MGKVSVKKTPAKNGRSPAQERRSSSRSMKDEQKSASALEDLQKTPRDATYTHLLPTEEQRRGNGRYQGRSLIKWNRPKMAEKLLLHIHYECTRHKISLPWDNIAHRLHPGSSGAAIQQHFNRMRRELLSEGHLVPPLGPKPGSGATDPEIRGFVRVEGGEPGETRPVNFGEVIEDPKFNLPGTFDDENEDDNAEERVYANVSNSSLEQPISPPTPMFIRANSMGMLGQSAHSDRHNDRFDKLASPQSAESSFSYANVSPYGDDLFSPGGSFNSKFSPAHSFHETHSSGFVTPVRRQKFFSPTTPDEAPYGNMGTPKYGFAQQRYTHSPVEFSPMVRLFTEEMALPRSSEHPSKPQQNCVSHETFSTDPWADQGESQRPDSAKMLMEDMMISGNDAGGDERSFGDSPF